MTRFLPTRIHLAMLLLTGLATLAGCSSVGDLLAGDKVDYRSTSTRTTGLEVPPDLSQLSRESRYQPPSGTVSASTFQAPTIGTAASGAAPAQPAGANAAGNAAAIAPQAVGDFKLEKNGNERWLSTSLPPETVFPQVRAFWKDNGFALVQDRADAGIVETDWAENRARLPNDFIRSAIGKVFDSAFSTGELDKYRTRVERTATGSDIYVTHRGMEEIYIGERRESTTWQPRPAEPQLEAEFLARLMVKLGAKEEQARTLLATSTATVAIGPTHARLLDNRPGPTLQVDDNFDRAWRRVGLALDRTGFTVEDRDRTQGLYFVRYVDPKFAGREEPNFLQRLFSSKKNDPTADLAKYRVKVTGEGSSSTVAVLDTQGKPEAGDAGKRIVALLLDDLK